MSENTAIEWCDHTFNPWIGCTKISPGCDHCYAEADFDKRRHVVTWGAGQERHATSATTWAQPYRWNHNAEAFQAQHGRRQRVFCASLADVFDNEVPEHWRADLFTLIKNTPNLDWLLLTKRIGNVVPMLAELRHGSDEDLPLLDLMPLPNVWIGATVVNQAEADRDVPKLLAVQARVRFLSIEPMLGPIDLGLQCENWSDDIVMGQETGSHECCKACGYTGIGNAIDWVICGGESGPKARPMHPGWARSLRDQCAAAGVPFLFKQWGEWRPISDMQEAEHRALYRSRVLARPHEDQSNLDDIYGRTCTVPTGVVHLDGTLHEPNEPMAFRVGTGAMQTFKAGKKAAGRQLDGVTHDQYPTSTGA